MAARAFARVAPVRAKVALVAVVALAVALAVRLGDVQIREGPQLSGKALAEHDSNVKTFAKRGSILDRDHGVLVHSRTSESVYAVPTTVGDKHKVALQLAPLLHVPAAKLESVLDDSGEFRWLARKVPHETAARVRKLAIPGIETKNEDTGSRLVAQGRLASTVIGFTDIDEKGLDGLEYSMDALLRGTPGQSLIESDLYGNAMPFSRTHVLKKAVAGRTIVTTIDPYLQFQAERALREGMKKWHARSATAIVMDPWTGELLAVANMPDFDPAHFGASSSDSWKNRAVSDAYEPGSTFKLITAAAALESGKFAPGVRFPARDALEVGGRVIHNAEDGMMAGGLGGSESIEQIIAYSHNVGAAEIGLATGTRAMYKMLHAFGFGEPTQVELTGENPGMVTDPKDLSGSSLATISFGHGISVTPLALVRAYAAIANGGILLRPRLIAAIEERSGKVVYRYGPEIEHRAISARTAATLRGYLRAVVDHGTGNPTARINGYTTAGKTGTAQVVGDNGFYESGAYIASFVGMIPAERPRYVILVKVERPHGSIYGSQVAAPIFTELARAAMFHAGVMPAAGPSRLVRTGHAKKNRR